MHGHARAKGCAVFAHSGISTIHHVWHAGMQFTLSCHVGGRNHAKYLLPNDA